MSNDAGARTHRLLHFALLAAILFVAIVARVYQYRGFGAIDDSAYAEIANRIATGEPIVGAYSGPPAFPLRAGITVPTAVFFGVFGVAEWTQAAFNFLMSMLGVLLAYACGRHFFSARAGLVAAAVTALIPIDTFHASILAPDPPSAITLGAAILGTVWLLESDGVTRNRFAIGGLVIGLILGLSWLTKEAVAYAAPFYLFLIVKERHRLSDVWVLWAGIAASSFAVLLAEAWFYQGATGDWLYHFAETERNYVENPRAFAVGGLNPGDDGYGRAVIRRIVYSGPLLMLVNPRLGYLPLIGGVLGLYGLWKRDKRYLVPAVWLFSLAMMFNFGSSSTRAYVPLLLFDRYMYPMLLPAVILVAGFIAQPWEGGDRSAEVRREQVFWSAALGLFLFLTFAYQNREYRSFSPGWTVESRELAATVLDPTDQVFTDAYSIHGLDFFWAYPETVNLVNFEDMSGATDVEPGDYALVNLRYLAQLEAQSGWWPTNSDPYVRPDFVTDPPGNWESVWSNGNATLYQAR